MVHVVLVIVIKLHKFVESLALVLQYHKNQVFHKPHGIFCSFRKLPQVFPIDLLSVIRENQFDCSGQIRPLWLSHFQEDLYTDLFVKKS